MKYIHIILCAAISACIAMVSLKSTAFSYQQQTEAQPVREVLTLSSVNTKDGPAVKLTIGDISFQSMKLTVQNGNVPKTLIYASKDKVIIEQGSREMAAKRIKTFIYNGILSPRQ